LDPEQPAKPGSALEAKASAPDAREQGSVSKRNLLETRQSSHVLAMNRAIAELKLEASRHFEPPVLKRSLLAVPSLSLEDLVGSVEALQFAFADL
jgi:hypothetical protein